MTERPRELGDFKGAGLFYPNVTTLRSGLCYRNSVRLSVCLSVCRLSSVCL